MAHFATTLRPSSRSSEPKVLGYTKVKKRFSPIKEETSDEARPIHRQST